MKRASYREAIAWIADNDEDAEMDVEVVAQLPSVLLISDIFDVDLNKVSSDVVKQRQKLSKKLPTGVKVRSLESGWTGTIVGHSKPSIEDPSDSSVHKVKWDNNQVVGNVRSSNRLEVLKKNRTCPECNNPTPGNRNHCVVCEAFIKCCSENHQGEHPKCPRCNNDETRRLRNYGKPMGNTWWCTQCSHRWHPFGS